MNISSETKIVLLRAVAFLLAFVLLASSALLFLHFYEKRQGNFPIQETSDFGNIIQYNNRNYVLKDNIQTFLIMGLDKYDESVDNTGYRNNQQADFAVLLVFDNEASKCTAIHINRDTITDVCVLGVAGEKVGTVKEQIALAHTYGNGKKVSCRNMATAVSGLLHDIKIDHYLSMTMDAVATVNDSVGGVEVEILDDFTDIDSALVKGQKVTLRGEQALTYVRTRYGMNDSSNKARMVRQRQYLTALYEKFITKATEDENFLSRLSLRISDYLISDCSVNQLQTLFDKVSTYDITDIRYFDGEYVVGDVYMEFYPDEESVKKTVVDLFYEVKE